VLPLCALFCGLLRLLLLLPYVSAATVFRAMSICRHSCLLRFVYKSTAVWCAAL
jgi:hypothetical protein